MKTLVAFYSRTGATKKLALQISRQLKCDCDEIVDTKNRSGIWGFLGACVDAYTKKMTEIRIKKKPTKYDVVVVGTPVWSGTMSSAVRTYLVGHKRDFRNVAFFCTMGGSGPQKTFAQMEESCGKKPKSLLSVRTGDVMQKQYDQPLKEFLGEVSK
jgi:menaquinone-dependent protoporphyrinogen IX oxidase